MADIAEPNPLPSRVRGGDAVAATLVDALFVINQDTDPGALAALCERHRHQTLLILTTHHPFPPEAERLAALAREVQLKHFADLVGDDEAAACDERATAAGS